MRIIRHLSSDGPAWAALRPDGSALAIDGDLFSDNPGHGAVDPARLVTGRVVTPGKLLAPVRPPNILAIGLNYRKHAEEGGKGVPERPMLFLKATSSLQNPGDPVEIPVACASHEVDFEAELAVVIGRRCKNVSREDALSYVLGYTCANDVSARDWQQRLGGGQFCQGKSFDTFCPLGPVLVTRDEIPDPGALKLRALLNGEIMQDWTTSDMVFDVATLVSFLSGSKTLLPGTVILTGTPHGVGFARKPPVFMKPGDTISIEIEKIGTLTNPVIAEPV
ncbi:5-carboxymethyl-2-hydroxymuconate isomerase [Opitutaceae bacterium TAV5]|nr:5-carboxymethyl-2-hydroxymuconate isomerase [Opitutaceae bacterium TAV5]